MFNFNMFVWQNWIKLFHAHLKGFPGFVFGILILAAIPMYIATTSIIIRTKKPLFVPKTPKWLLPVKEENAEEKKAEEISETQAEEKTKSEPQKEEKIIPVELRQAFLRARVHAGPNPKSNFDISNVSEQFVSPKIDKEPELQSAGELPVPTDFDINKELEDTDSDIPSFSPIFSDINFDEEETESLKNAEGAAEEISSELLPVTEYLSEKGIKFTIGNNIIITEQNAIAAHTDSDFWIADEETWFAAGKQKPSPIPALLSTAESKDLKPILYLGKTNILDLESNKEAWSKKGIKIITNLDELN